MTQSKKGINALQIHRQIGTGEYRTAWYMCLRIRAAMSDKSSPKLMGEVEVDETYIVGKEKNKHKWQRIGGSGTTGKVAVIGAISRKGKVVAKVIENTDTHTLNQFVNQAVSEEVSLVATDEHSGYRHLKAQGFHHETVKHEKGKYVRGLVHTSNLDRFWGLLKRGIVGSFHHVSKEYLPLYLAEFSFRHNHRHNPFMFDEVVKEC